MHGLAVTPEAVEATAAIIHEIGQPLTGIYTNARAGLRLLASGAHDVGAVREILDDIVADVHRARHVIERLRVLLRTGEVQRRPLPLHQVIDDVVALVRRDAERRQVSIVRDVAPRLPRVSGDRVQLQQVLVNLVVNACEAMADVADRPRRVVLRARSLAGGGVRVEVSDTGPGIAPGAVESIFEPFVTSKARGMGVGLWVSRAIVAAHGGRLWAENGVGGGATFHLVLPANR